MRNVSVFALLLALGACGQEKPAQADASPDRKPESVAIAEFWTWFEGAKERIGQPSYQRDTVMEVGDQIHKISPDLTFEIGLATEPKEFIVSAGGLKSVVPLVERVVAAAPQIEGWKIVAFKQPQTEGPLHTIYGSVTLHSDQIKYKLTPGPELPSLILYIDQSDGASNNDYMGAGFTLLDSLIGEYNVMTKIGPIAFEPLANAPADAKPFVSLRDDLK
jgi:hypothetical protein